MTTNEPLQHLQELGTLLDTALHIVQERVADPLRRKLDQVFDRMPREDRPVVVSVLAREVAFRTATLDEGETLTGWGARVNPGARIYLRSFEKAPPADALPLSHDELVFSSLRSARLMQAVLAPAIHDAWRAATLEAFTHLDAEERARVTRVLGTLLELVAASGPVAPSRASGAE